MRGCDITTSDTWWCIRAFWWEKWVTTLTWTQWDTRPRMVVYRYEGEDKADRQMSGHH